MIDKYYEVVCDNCGAAIGHYKGTKKDAVAGARKHGAKICGDKQYCDARCKSNGKRKVRTNSCK
jgi:hypothetical protein